MAVRFPGLIGPLHLSPLRVRNRLLQTGRTKHFPASLEVEMAERLDVVERREVEQLCHGDPEDGDAAGA